MTNSQRLATVRESFLRWIADDDSNEQGPDGSESQSTIQSESILVRNEFYCGRRFRSEFHYAVWFIEEDTLKIFRKDGSLARVLRGNQIDNVASHPAILPMSSHQIDDEDRTSQDRETRRAA